MKTIRNIIFDLGGVIINIDYDLTAAAFRKLGAEKFDELYSQMKQTNLFDDFETGKISAQQFRAEVKKMFSKKISDTQINSAWCAMLLDFPEKRIELLKKLSAKYRLFLLSNTNEIHIAEVFNILNREHNMDNWNGIFQKEYYSHRINMRKPDREIYEFVLKQNMLNPLETFFVDDSEQNIAGAEKTGIKTHHLKQGEDILNLRFWV